MIFAAWLCAGVLGLLLGHTVVNRSRLCRPPAIPSPVDGEVAVLVPARDEEPRIGACLRAALDQRGVPGLSVVVLDDGSTDGTADLVRQMADPRLRLLTGAPPPPGWLGKPYACHQLAAATPAPTLVFLDADVVLAPTALAAAVGCLDGFDLLSAYPRLVAVSAAERLIQPLLPWSWLTFLPLRAMQRSPRPSLAAAGGQFLVVDRAGYERAGGHAAVRDRVLEDVELARAVKRGGGRISIADFSAVAACRMYDSPAALVAGYSKSLWAGVHPVVAMALILMYAVPVLAALTATACAAWALATPLWTSYALAVAGRVVTGRATRARVWPDALAHPASIALLAGLVARSRTLRRRGALVWKGRAVG